MKDIESPTSTAEVVEDEPIWMRRTPVGIAAFT